MKALNIGIIGMGGFAETHHAAVLALESNNECRLICTCDPNMSNFTESAEKLKFAERKVQLYDDYLTMLNAHQHKLDVVCIPTPIHLHRKMHKACVERGLAVYLEKPPTLDYSELEEMLINESKAKHATHVGFMHLSEPERHSIKKRIANNEFGKLKLAVMSDLRPRSASYFHRNAWAGKLKLDNTLILDSCMGNAISHAVHLMLYWAGTASLWQWAQPYSVQAELYRANNIQSADTFFVSTKIDNGAELRICMSHACEGDERRIERLEFEKAVIETIKPNKYRIFSFDNEIEDIVVHPHGVVQTLKR